MLSQLCHSKTPSLPLWPVFQIDASVDVCFPSSNKLNQPRHGRSIPTGAPLPTAAILPDRCIREWLLSQLGHPQAPSSPRRPSFQIDASVYVCFPSTKAVMGSTTIIILVRPSLNVMLCAQDSTPPGALFGSPRHLSLSLHVISFRSVGRSPLLGLVLTASLPSLSQCVSV